MSNFGLLLTMTETAAADEDEFNSWYDSEHMHERISIRGFVSARRWVADVEPGQGKYLASYELVSPAVLESDEYLAHVGDGQTAWSKRTLERMTVFRRWACEQILPGDALPHMMAHALFLAAGDVAPEHEEEFNRWYDEEHIPLLVQVPGVLGARRFRASSGTPKYLALYDLADENVPQHPAWQAATRTEWARRIDDLTAGSDWLLRLYRSYVPASRRR